MNRRKLLKMIGIGSVGVAVPVSMVAATSDLSAQQREIQRREIEGQIKPLQYRGYRILWTGWKGGAPYEDRLVGQWLGVPLVEGVRPLLYSSVPGWHGTFIRGDAFDIATNAHKGQAWIDSSTSETTKEQQRAQGLSLLKEIIFTLDTGGVGALEKLLNRMHDRFRGDEA